MFMNNPYSLWLSRPKTIPNSKIRLFCFPYAGGGATLYRPWVEALPPEIEVVAVQLPGRENRLGETPFLEIEPLLDALVPAILPHLNEKPFAFFGYSLGALVSYELVRRLQSEARILPRHLFVAARRAPHLPGTNTPLHDLSDEDFMAELRRLKGTPDEILRQTDLMQFLLPLLRADFTLNETYIYQERSPLTVPITAFGGLSDDDISRDDMDAWRCLTTEKFTLRMMQGDHFFIHTARTTLLQAICREVVVYL
jgi:medium-chain acyl-[acyl-carrier-protein] hydrolase